MKFGSGWITTSAKSLPASRMFLSSADVSFQTCPLKEFSPVTMTAQAAPAGTVVKGDFLSRMLHQRELTLSMMLIAILVVPATLRKDLELLLVRCRERDGLVVRARDPEDSRAFRVHLTARAHEFRPVADEVLLELDTKVLAALGRRQRQALVRALKGVMEL